jgi:predicted nucleic-acid-binding protein
MTEKEIINLIIDRLQNTINFLVDHPDALGKSQIYASQATMLDVIKAINEERK